MNAIPAVCPECGATLRVLHLALSPTAPFSFRCRSCASKLQFESIGQYAVGILWAVAVASVTLVIAALCGAFSSYLGIGIGGIATGLTSSTAMLIYVLRHAVLVRREPYEPSQLPGLLAITAAGLLVLIAVAYFVVSLINS